jgi:methyl-accepting chemotaxis protein
MRIRTKVLLGIALVVVSVLSGTAFTYMSVRQQRAALNDIDVAADTVAREAIQLIRAAKDIQLDVVQVQQFLSDISATRAQDGLDDGFKDAQEFADKFRRDVAAAAEVADTLHRPDIARLLSDAISAFGPYYENGRRISLIPSFSRWNKRIG